MPTSDAQARATKKYNEKMDSIRLVLPKEIGLKIRIAAEASGLSMTSFIRETLEARIDKIYIPSVTIDNHEHVNFLIQSYEDALQELQEANKAQFDAQTKFQARADALNNFLKEV